MSKFDYLITFGYSCNHFSSSWITSFKCFTRFSIYKFIVNEKLTTQNNILVGIIIIITREIDNRLSISLSFSRDNFFFNIPIY